MANFPDNWLYGCVVPEPNPPLRPYVQTDGFIASSGPLVLDPPYKLKQTEPLCVSLSRKESTGAPLPREAFDIINDFSRLGVSPRINESNGYIYSKFGPIMDKRQHKWIYVVIITNIDRSLAITVGTSANQNDLKSHGLLRKIADSVQPVIE